MFPRERSERTRNVVDHILEEHGRMKGCAMRSAASEKGHVRYLVVIRISHGHRIGAWACGRMFQNLIF